MYGRYVFLSILWSTMNAPRNLLYGNSLPQSPHVTVVPSTDCSVSLTSTTIESVHTLYPFFPNAFMMSKICLLLLLCLNPMIAIWMPWDVPSIFLFTVLNPCLVISNPKDTPDYLFTYSASFYDNYH